MDRAVSPFKALKVNIDDFKTNCKAESNFKNGEESSRPGIS